jgi:hypothetical protein
MGLVDHGLRIEAADRANDAGKPPSGAEPNFKINNEYPSARLKYYLASSLEKLEGPLAHDPSYDQLFDTYGNLKTYDDIVNFERGAVSAGSEIEGLLWNYRDGILRADLTQLNIAESQGNQAVT